MQKINRRYKIRFVRGQKVYGLNQLPDYEFTIEYPITCRFEVSRDIYSAVNTGGFQLLNLSENNRAKLYKDRMDENIYINMEVYAGYGDFMPLIFFGNIKQCYSYRDGGSTDFITDIEAWDAGFAIQTGYTSATFAKGVDTQKLFESLMYVDMSSVKKGIISPIINKSTTRSVSFLGNTWDILNRLSSNNAFIDNNTLHVLGDNQVIEGDFLLLNTDTGLLGSPKRSDLNLSIETIFEPQVKVGQLIKLESSTLKYLNQNYKVVGFKHLGIIGEGENGTLKTTWNLFIGNKIFEMMTQSRIVEIKASGNFIKPVNAPITSYFGKRLHPVLNDIKPHRGIDFGCPEGTSVKASSGGLIVAANWIYGYGKTIMINHGILNGINMTSLYGHLSSLNVKIGDKVTQGQIIALSGQTGELVKGANLHFEIAENGHKVDPLKYLKESV